MIKKKKPTYGSVLRELRRYSNLTQGQLAEHLEVTAAYISAVEKGGRAPFDRERTKEIEYLLGKSEALQALAGVKSLPCGCRCTCA